MERKFDIEGRERFIREMDKLERAVAVLRQQLQSLYQSSHPDPNDLMQAFGEYTRSIAEARDEVAREIEEMSDTRPLTRKRDPGPGAHSAYK